MAGKVVTISDVRVRTDVFDAQRSKRGTPDTYVIMKSQKAQAGDRRERQMNSRRPIFQGPYTFGLGPQEAEQVRVELWDHDRGSGAGDDLMETAVLALDAEAPRGTRTWPLSEGGDITVTWHVQGRPPSGEPAVKAATATVVGVATVQIQSLALIDLPAADGRKGRVDPYVLLTGRSAGAQLKWATRWNEPSPVWQDHQEVAADPEGYEIQVFDEDTSSGDDLLGSVFVASFASPGGEVRLQLVSRGEVVIVYAVTGEADARIAAEAKKAEEGGAGLPEMPKVLRREIRKMPGKDQRRFAIALKTLMENADGPQTSEYFRIAGYHGWPNDYCQHGQETFPGWHRAYLVELERALIRADKELGNDGDIGLPYWDWSIEEVDGEVFPRIIRDVFPELPEDFLDPSDRGASQLAKRGYSRFHADKRLAENIRKSKVAFQAEQCLAVGEHWMHASTRFNRQGYPIEAPHNSIHMNCGFPMTSLRFAAFHPAFFLHHCNIDRIYERHVQMETPTECAREFSSRQQQLAAEGEGNRYVQPLEPFEHPFERRKMMPADTFDTQGLGYSYDELPPEPAMQLREPPIFAAFVAVHPLQLNERSFTLHVFVLPVGSAESFAGLSVDPESWLEDPRYAGSGAILCGKGPECGNCASREPYNVLVEVQEALARQRLSRHDAELRVVFEDEDGEYMPLSSGTPPGVPQPVLVGPLFEETQSSMIALGDAWASAAPSGEARQLQTALADLGYAAGSADGLFGPQTEGAVRSFQRFNGLAVDGAAGPKTKKMIMQQRPDRLPDVPVAGEREARHYVEGAVVRYVVGPLPGYLDAERAGAEIDEAFGRWGAAMGISFVRTGSGLRASLRVDFVDLAGAGETVARPGGQLAEASRQGVRLDAAERWLLRGEVAPARLFPAAASSFAEGLHPLREVGHHAMPARLLPVLLHEVGHVIGLTHSSRPEDVMWPYSRPDEDVQLSTNDRERAKTRVIPSDAAVVASLNHWTDSAGSLTRSKFELLMKDLDATITEHELDKILADSGAQDGDAVNYEKLVTFLFASPSGAGD